DFGAAIPNAVAASFILAAEYMTEHSVPLEILACPRCGKTPLEKREAKLYCGGCDIAFPDFAGLPWLFAEPGATWHEWRSRWDFMLRNLNANRERSVTALAAPEGQLRDSTRARLQRRIEADAAHIESMRSLLAPFEMATPDSDFAMYLALRTRLPPDQGLLTYYSNVHRDWAWGNAENAASLELLTHVIATHSPRRMLVLGAGAGRLAYDLHRHYRPELTLGLDFNPLLVSIAARVSAGEKLRLREFPIAPRSIADYGVEHELESSAAEPGLHWIIGDTHRPPFAPRSFDTIVTPWLIDIVPEQLENFIGRINHLLADAGLWVNFGSLSFQNVHPAQQFSLEECLEIVQEKGFAEPLVETREMSYLSSPASRHGRSEEVVAWAAPKTSHVKKTPKYAALPDWIVRGNTPIPLTQSVRTQATSSQVHGFLLALIDGRRTLHDIAKIAVERRLLQPSDAEETIRNFLIKMADESRRLGY
ncbi:MAG TPA: Trm112 family protein, partial [Gammaproteobacteria bacterium]|nr:Trm112 family protein [Gammaproteobacteria bacterium]